MILRRRTFLHLAATTALLPALSAIAQTQTYPSKPVRLIVPFPAGGTPDLLARLLGQQVGERMGQPFIVENRIGAGANIGTEAAAKASPDGYTLLLVTSPNMINATLYDKLNFNFVRDIAPVASSNTTPYLVVVDPSFPAKSLPEFIAYAKANPGKINMASTGTGNLSHVAGELFKMMAGVDILHVPYRGETQAQADLFSGRVQVMFDPIVASIEYVKTNKLRALAATTSARLEVFPDLPTVSEFVPGYEVRAVVGIGAPSTTPAGIIDKLNKEINAVLSDAKIKERIAALGATPLMGSPEDFGKLIAAETEKWGKVIKSANIKPE
jgi:tripartite-type tricarboxylate transporter receptor subunit TctC